jgi:hypothetical protein
VALAVGTWWRPSIGLAAVLCLYGLKQWGQSTTEFLADYRQITNYAVGVIALIGVALAASRRSCIFCQLPGSVSLIWILYAYAFMSIAWAPDTLGSLQQWGIQGPYIATVVLLAPLLLSTVQDVRTAFLATAITGATICGLALLFGNWGFRGLILYGDVTETETNPLALASMAGTVLVIAGLSLIRPNIVPIRVFALACIPVALAVILKSGSRGQLLASGMGLVAAWPIAVRLKDMRSFGALLVAATLLIGLGWWAYTLVDIDTNRWSSIDSNDAVLGRLALARALLSIAASHPLTMLFGLGNSSAITLLSIYPHITGIEVLAEEGLLGAVIYISIIILTFRSVSRVVRTLGERQRERHAVAMLVGLFVFELVLSWKQGTLLSSVYVFAYSIMLGRIDLQLVEGSTPAEPQLAMSSRLPPFSNLMP